MTTMFLTFLTMLLAAGSADEARRVGLDPPATDLPNQMVGLDPPYFWLLAAGSADEALSQDSGTKSEIRNPQSAIQGLFNPYERPKNGPPLTNVFHKVKSPSWFLAKIGNPMSHPAARMPDLKVTDDEVLDIMAYLKSIADPDFAEQHWPAWADKGFEDMDDDELDAMFELTDRGQAVWSNARCSICHRANGPSGEFVGGFVDLRVGGIDLMGTGPKLTRNWLYAWIKEPKVYFPNTLMPRFRLDDADIRALVEYLLRDDAFRPPEDAEADDPERWKVLDEPQRITHGRQLIELSRCVVCHDIKGIPEILSLPAPDAGAGDAPPTGTFEFLAYDLRCLSCHAIDGRGGTYAPDLTGEGSRLLEDWIADFVESPDMIRPLSQQMPKFNLTADEAKIIASYMSTSRRDPRIPERIPGGEITEQKIERGREIFRAKGCLSCHTADAESGGVVGPDLRLVAERLKPGAIWFHLKNPHTVNPYSAEPDYGLPVEDVRALSAYLSTRKE